jgi:hypothetical protein
MPRVGKTMDRKRNLRRLEEESATQRVELWNLKHPPGTRVAFRYVDDGPELGETVTCSKAWLVCGSPCVLIEARAGGWALSHLRVLDAAEGSRS